MCCHTLDGFEDMLSHLRSMITRTTETIPVIDGDLALGTWQSSSERRSRPPQKLGETLIVTDIVC